MSKIIFIALVAIFVSTNANASLQIQCKAKTANITTSVFLNNSTAKVQVTRDGSQIYSALGFATYNEKWENIILDATKSNQEELNGIKIYFESARNEAVAIRPYGSTAKDLTPGSEGITLYGMKCNHSYQSIKNEVFELKF